MRLLSHIREPSQGADPAGVGSMIKVIALIKRKAGISRQDFVSHYEEIHVPLAVNGIPSFAGYVRNHIIVAFVKRDPAFDCLSEFWYPTTENLQKVLEFLKSDASQIIHQDERTFMDTNGNLHFRVSERISGEGWNSPKESPGVSLVKAMVLVTRKSGISLQEFAYRYEEVYASQAKDHAKGLKKYILNYVDPLYAPKQSPCDCIAELWFEDMEACRAVSSQVRSNATQLAWEDENSLVDPHKRLFIVVDERISIMPVAWEARA